MMGLLRRLGGDPRLVAIEAQWREQIQAERDTSTPPSPPRDERPADILCLDLVAPDEDVRARAALELEWRTIERVHELMDGGLPQERVRRQVLDETRRELHRLSPGVAARLVLLAAEHEDYCGWLPFTGHDAYVRCVGTAIKAWGSLAESARDALRSLETHESARLRTLAKEGLRAIRG
jgi:hypothetical protein